MGLSTSVYRELKTEVEGLRRLRKQIDQKITAIEAILAPLDVQRDDASVDHIAPTSDKPDSLRAAIPAAILAKGHTLKPMEITIAIQETGFPNGGKTPLATRVRNEAWRMAKEGKLTRTKKGRYGIKDGSLRMPISISEGGGG